MEAARFLVPLGALWAVYWMVALFVSLYYGYRGVLISKHTESGGGWKEREQRIVHRPQAFILNFSGGLAGFLAGAYLIQLGSATELIGSEDAFSLADSVTTIFISIVAFTGTTGILPEMLYRGNLFKTR